MMQNDYTWSLFDEGPDSWRCIDDSLPLVFYPNSIHGDYGREALDAGDVFTASSGTSVGSGRTVACPNEPNALANDDVVTSAFRSAQSIPPSPEEFTLAQPYIAHPRFSQFAGHSLLRELECRMEEGQKLISPTPRKHYRPKPAVYMDHCYKEMKDEAPSMCAANSKSAPRYNDVWARHLAERTGAIRNKRPNHVAIDSQSKVRKATKGRGRRQSAGSTGPRLGCKPQGVTMRLRTLLRKLLAGSNWIMDSSISKDQATQLIYLLVGEDMAAILQLSAALQDSGTAQRDRRFATLLPNIMSYHLGFDVTTDDAERFICRDRGAYHLTSDFKALLKSKAWPPHLPEELVLRSYGCYMAGEASATRVGESGQKSVA